MTKAAQGVSMNRNTQALRRLGRSLRLDQISRDMIADDTLAS